METDNQGKKRSCSLLCTYEYVGYIHLTSVCTFCVNWKEARVNK